MHEKSIVRPPRFRGFKKEKIVYVPFDPAPRVIKARIESLAERSLQTGAGVLYLLEDKVVLYQSLGAPAAALSLESLAAGGAETVTILGFCGSLVPRLKIGDAVSVSGALSDEGTSPRYCSGREFFVPSPALKADIEERLRRAGLGFVEAPVVSTDAPCRETMSWLSRMAGKGIGGVDMEASAVFCLAQALGFEAAALMLVSDELATGTWKSRFPGKLLKQKAEEYFLPFL